MNETTLQKKLDRIREVIESQHLVCVSYLRDGASEVDLVDVDAFIGEPLPPSLRAFLRQHDGLHVSGWSHGEGEPVQLLSAQYSFTVCGTGEIKKFTLGLRRYIDGIDLETIGENAGISNLRQRAERCINIAILYDFSQRICYSLDAPLKYGEFELFEADVDECMNWLLWIVKDFDKIHVANSVEAFIEQSLSFMIQHGTGFNYWRKGNSPGAAAG